MSNCEKTESATKELSELSSENIKQITSHLINELSDFLGNKKENAIEAKNKILGCVKEHPLKVIAGTLALGAIIGLIYRR